MTRWFLLRYDPAVPRDPNKFQHKELVQINHEKYALIQEYAQSYGSFTDAQAEDWSKRALKLDTDVAALRQKYWPNFRKVLPAKKAAMYEQVERRAQMLIDVQLASQIPLLQP